MDTAEWDWVTHWTDLLDQDEVWRDAAGKILLLDGMEPDYCSRVRSFCLRNAERALDMVLYDMAHGPMPGGEAAVDCFNREWDMLEDAGEDPRTWLEKAPLLIALKYRSEGLPARPAVCHCGYPFVDDGGVWDHSACHPGIIVD